MLFLFLLLPIGLLLTLRGLERFERILDDPRPLGETAETADALAMSPAGVMIEPDDPLVLLPSVSDPVTEPAA